MRPRTIATLTLIVAALLATTPLAAEPRPSSDLLLPYFEVDLESAGGKTTLFSIGNAADEPLTVRASVATNWGIRVLETDFELTAGEVRTVNLRDWLLRGELPSRVLGPGDLAHVQAALTGQLSPKDSLYYGTQPDPFQTGLAVGYVTLRVTGNPRSDSLWGDYFWVTPDEDFAEGELLVNIDRTMQCSGLCDVHRLRFLDGGGFSGGTKLIIWSPKVGTPSPEKDALTVGTVISASAFHKESGDMFKERDLDLLPVQLLDVRDLLLDEPFGWVDLGTDRDVYVGVRYSADQRYSMTLQSWCIPEKDEPPCTDCGNDPGEAAIDLEKLTNGEDADTPPGAFVSDAGDSVTWEFIVTNTGEVALTDIEVTDDQEGAIACPEDSLAPGASMTCTLAGNAPASVPATGFQYANLGEVVGTDPDGGKVTDEDPSHYRVPGEQAPLLIDVEKATNGADADAAPGPYVAVGGQVAWSYVVTNTNAERTLVEISVTDDKEGAVTCPKTTLAPGESMTCTPKQGVAAAGQYANLATVTGKDSESAATVTDTDPSHYNGQYDPPQIDVEKATNGHDADAGPGPELTEGEAVTWTYVVTNTGPVALSNVVVQDDKEGVASCPRTTLDVGESMTCTLSGVATTGNYANLGTATGEGPGGSQAQDSDPSHYWVPEPPECGGCEGKITHLELLYGGATCVTVEAHATPGQRFGDPVVFGPATVCPGDSFDVYGNPSGSPGFNGTLGTNLELFIDGSAQPSASIHTSCSQEVGPGFVAGVFTVVEAESQYGGPLCPLN